MTQVKVKRKKERKGLRVGLFVNLLSAPEGVSSIGSPGRVGGVTLEADVGAAVVRDAVASGVGAYGIPVRSIAIVFAAAAAFAAAIIFFATVLAFLLFTVLAFFLLASLLFKLGLLALEFLLLALKVFALGFFFLFLLFVVLVNLVGEETGAYSQGAAEDGSSDIAGNALDALALHALEVGFIDKGLAGDRFAGDFTGRAVETAGNQDHVEDTSFLTLDSEELEETVDTTAGSVDDLVDRDGSEADDFIDAGFFIHNFNVEVGLADQGDLEGLVPLGVLASALLGESLGQGLAKVLLGRVFQRELDVGVLGTHQFNALELLGMVDSDREGAGLLTFNRGGLDASVRVGGLGFGGERSLGSGVREHYGSLCGRQVVLEIGAF